MVVTLTEAEILTVREQGKSSAPAAGTRGRLTATRKAAGVDGQVVGQCYGGYEQSGRGREVPLEGMIAGFTQPRSWRALDRPRPCGPIHGWLH